MFYFDTYSVQNIFSDLMFSILKNHDNIFVIENIFTKEGPFNVYKRCSCFYNLLCPSGDNAQHLGLYLKNEACNREFCKVQDVFFTLFPHFSHLVYYLFLP